MDVGCPKSSERGATLKRLGDQYRWGGGMYDIAYA